MIYLDASVFIKLFLIEVGSEKVSKLVTEQEDALPIWQLLEVELINALRYKEFTNQLVMTQVEELVALFKARKNRCLYFYPLLDQSAFLQQCLSFTELTPTFGCRTLDIQHVAVAKLLEPKTFVTADLKQERLASAVGLKTILIN